MSVTREQLNELFDSIHKSPSNWQKKAMELYEKSMAGNLTSSERAEWQRVQDRNYLDFADAADAQAKMGFLQAYLKADTGLQASFRNKAVDLFTPGQFSVIAVRLNSLDVLDLGMANLIDYLSSSHDYHPITELKLIYHSARLLNQNPDTFLQGHLSRTSDAWAHSFIQGFLNQSEAEKVNSGYEAVHDLGFGYIKARKPPATWASTLLSLFGRSK